MSETAPQFDEAAAQAAGVVTQVPAPADYWGFDVSENWFFPDGLQYLTLQKMNEGGKKRYQKATRSDVKIARQSGEATLKADPAEERQALIKACVVGWNVYRNGQPVPYSPRVFEDFLDKLDPSIVEEIEKACRKLNPWLLADMSIEDIDKEIENLREMRDEKLKQEAGE